MGYGRRYWREAEPQMAAPPQMDLIEHRATCSWPTRSADGNTALRGVGSTELPEATTLALDRMCLLMETPSSRPSPSSRPRCEGQEPGPSRHWGGRWTRSPTGTLGASSGPAATAPWPNRYDRRSSFRETRIPEARFRR